MTSASAQRCPDSLRCQKRSTSTSCFQRVTRLDNPTLSYPTSLGLQTVPLEVGAQPAKRKLGWTQVVGVSGPICTHTPSELRVPALSIKDTAILELPSSTMALVISAFLHPPCFYRSTTLVATTRKPRLTLMLSQNPQLNPYLGVPARSIAPMPAAQHGPTVDLNGAGTASKPSRRPVLFQGWGEPISGSYTGLRILSFVALEGHSKFPAAGLPFRGEKGAKVLANVKRMSSRYR